MESDGTSNNSSCIIHPSQSLVTVTKTHLVYKPSSCQGCSLRLTGTRGLVGEGGVKGCWMPLGAKTAQVPISMTAPMVKRQQRRGAK